MPGATTDTLWSASWSSSAPGVPGEAIIDCCSGVGVATFDEEECWRRRLLSGRIGVDGLLGWNEEGEADIDDARLARLESEEGKEDR